MASSIAARGPCSARPSAARSTARSTRWCRPSSLSGVDRRSLAEEAGAAAEGGGSVSRRKTCPSPRRRRSRKRHSRMHEGRRPAEASMAMTGPLTPPEDASPVLFQVVPPKTSGIRCAAVDRTGPLCARSANAASAGSTAAGVWPRIGRTSTARHCLPQSRRYPPHAAKTLQPLMIFPDRL